MQALSPLSVKQMSTILRHSHYPSLLTAKEERAQLCLFVSAAPGETAPDFDILSCMMYVASLSWWWKKEIDAIVCSWVKEFFFLESSQLLLLLIGRALKDL